MFNNTRLSSLIREKEILIVLMVSLVSACIILCSTNEVPGYLFITFLFCFAGVIVGIQVLPIILQKLKRLFLNINRIHFLWILLFISSLNLRTRTGYQLVQNPIDIAALFRICIVLIVGFFILPKFFLSLNKFQELFKGLFLFFTIYVGLAFFSSIYSTYFLLTLWKSFEVFLNICVIALLFSSSRHISDIKHLLNINWFLLGVLMLTMWIGWFTFPEWATTASTGIIKTQLGGTLIPANSCGEIGAILGIISFSRLLVSKIYKEKMLYFLVLFFAIITLIFAQSRTTILGFLVVVPIILFLNKKGNGILLFLYFSFFIGVITFIFKDILFSHLVEFIARGQNTKLLFSITGRIPMWTSSWNMIQRRLFWGYGFGVGSRIIFMSQYAQDLTSLHNAWMEILLNLGITGLIFFLIAFIRVWKILLTSMFSKKFLLLKNELTPFLMESIGVLAIITIRTTTSSAIGGWQSLSLLTYLSIFAFAHTLDKLHRIPKKFSC